MPFTSRAILAVLLASLSGSVSFLSAAEEPPLPAHVAVRLGSSQFRFQGDAKEIRILADGKASWLLMEGANYVVDQVLLLDLTSGKTVGKLQVKNLLYALSPGEGKAAIVSDGKVKVHDLKSGKVEKEIELGIGKDSVSNVTYSPDGQELFVSLGRELLRVQLKSGNIERLGRLRVDTDIKEVLFFPGKGVTVKTESHQVWQHKPEGWALQFKPPPDVEYLAFSPDGKLVVGRAGVDRNDENQDRSCWRLWSLETGKLVREGPSTSHKGDLRFSPDGKLLFDAGDGRTWNVATLEETTSEQEMTSHRLTLSKDGKLMAFTWEDAFWIVQTATRTELTRPDKRARGYHQPAVAFSPDGKQLLIAEEGLLRRWSVAEGKEILPPPGHQGQVLALAYSPDGKIVASSGLDGVRVWDAQSGKHLGYYPVPAGGGQAHTMTFTPNSKTLAVGWTGGLLSQLDGATGQCRQTFKTDGIIALRYANEGKTFAAIDVGKDWLLGWDAATGKEVSLIREYQKPPPTLNKMICYAIRYGGCCNVDDYSEEGALKFAIAPDGRTLAIAKLGQVGFWELASGKLVKKVKVIDGPWVYRSGNPDQFDGRNAMAFTPDGKALALTQRGRICLVEADTGKHLRGLGFGISEDIVSLAFTPDSKSLIFCDVSGQVWLQDVATGTFRGSFPNGIWSRLALAPDGKHLALAVHDGTINIWKVPEVFQSPAKVAVPECDVTELWKKLADYDPAVARVARQELARVPDQAMALIQKEVAPVVSANAKHVDKLLADLGNDDYDLRKKATDELAVLEDQVVPALERFLKGDINLEARKRAEDLLAMRAAHVELRPHQLRVLRALALLESIGTPQARQCLTRLAEGASDARLTRDAKASLERLSRRKDK